MDSKVQNCVGIHIQENFVEIGPQEAEQYSLSTQTRSHGRVRGSLAILGFPWFSLGFLNFSMLFLGFRAPGDLMARPYGRIWSVQERRCTVLLGWRNIVNNRTGGPNNEYGGGPGGPGTGFCSPRGPAKNLSFEPVRLLSVLE